MTGDLRDKVVSNNSNSSTNSRSSSSGSSSGGCYIATCVYGSYDCPNVCVLRRFRDNVLAKTFAGRIFIKTYYAISPSLVRTLGRSEVVKKIWAYPLDKLVAFLKSRGFSDKIYKD